MATNTQTQNLPPQAGIEVGKSGTYFFKGYVTAEEYSIDLQGKYALQVYDVMRKSDPTVHAILNVCKQPILGTTWDIEPASEDTADVEIADNLKRELFDRNIVFSDVMRESLTCLDFGFAVQELVYENTEYQGKTYIGIKKIASRKQRSVLKWEMDEPTGQPGIVQILPTGGYANIPREKLLYVVNDQEGENYFGVSMLRYAYKPWKIKDGLEIMNAVALENMALGIPYIKKGINDETVDETELNNARNTLRQQRINEEAYLEFPASIEIGFIDMKSQTTKDVKPTIEYLNRQIELSVLAQFLDLGAAGGSGSRAVSQDHSRLFVKALVAVARMLQHAYQRDIVQKWVDLNYSNLQNGYPKLIFSNISDEDVVATADAVNKLMSAGALTPDKDIENRLRQLLNLPELSADMYENYEAPKQAAPVIPSMQPDNTSNAPAQSGGGDNELPDDLSEPVKATIKKARAIQRELLGSIAEG